MNLVYEFTPTATAAVVTFNANNSAEPNRAVLNAYAVHNLEQPNVPCVPVNHAPVANAGAGQTVESTGSMTSVTLNGSASSDPDGDPLTYAWAWVGGSVTGVNPSVNGAAVDVASYVSSTDVCGVSLAISPAGPYALGNTAVTVTATDCANNASSSSANVSVVDTTAPVLTAPADVSVEANAVLSAVEIGSATATDIFGATVVSNAPATYPVGTTVVIWTATDGNGLITTGMQHVTVVDSTAPVVTAQLIPLTIRDDDGDDEHEHHAEGLFKVVFTATDIADPNPVVTAMLNGATVINGQIVQLERDDEAKWELEHGKLEIKGMSFSLNVSATDASANVGSAIAAFAFPSEERDEHKKDKKDKKDRKHNKHDD